MPPAPVNVVDRVGFEIEWYTWFPRVYHVLVTCTPRVAHVFMCMATWPCINKHVIGAKPK